MATDWMSVLENAKKTAIIQDGNTQIISLLQFFKSEKNCGFYGIHIFHDQYHLVIDYIEICDSIISVELGFK